MSKIIYLPEPFDLKPYSKKELAAVLKISPYVLNVWIAPIEDEVGEPLGGYYNIKQIRIIVERYGLPGQLVNDSEFVKKAA